MSWFHSEGRRTGAILASGQVLALCAAWLIVANAVNKDNGLGWAAVAYVGVTFVSCLLIERAERASERTRERELREDAQRAASQRANPEASHAAMPYAGFCWSCDEQCSGTPEWVIGARGDNIMLCDFHARRYRDGAATAVRTVGRHEPWAERDRTGRSPGSEAA